MVSFGVCEDEGLPGWQLTMVLHAWMQEGG